jgi:hypothetical protein
MSANGESTRKIILTGGGTARSGIGRLHLVTAGSYQASEFNGGDSTSNSKAPLSTACPLLPDDVFMGESWSRHIPASGPLATEISFTPDCGRSGRLLQRIRKKDDVFLGGSSGEPHCN